MLDEEKVTYGIYGIITYHAMSGGTLIRNICHFTVFFMLVQFPSCLPMPLLQKFLFSFPAKMINLRIDAMNFITFSC